MNVQQNQQEYLHTSTKQSVKKEVEAEIDTIVHVLATETLRAANQRKKMMLSTQKYSPKIKRLGVKLCIRKGRSATWTNKQQLQGPTSN